ncbi:MAG: Ig domain protein group 1 domain protein [Rhodoglobus sp.]|nr:Ig domain protein group 1 domain protein [Rhodoglobus sp.]
MRTSSVLATALLTAIGLAVLPAGGATAAPTSASFTTPGGPYTYTVPAGVTSIRVTAQGGTGASYAGPGIPSAGGAGGLVTADLPVTTGQTLQVYVAGNGSGAAGGANGGGNGSNLGNGVKMGGGGGASDIRTAAGDLSTRLVVAAGGGGSTPATNGGDADQPAPPNLSSLTTAGAGTQSAGGAGGTASFIAVPVAGKPGTFGNGGDGTPMIPVGVGGGGGGYFGGGGGAWTGSGAGGSNFVAPSARNATIALGARDAAPFVQISPNITTAVSVTSADAQLVANGVSTTTVTATVTDDHGGPVIGADVAFSGSLGNAFGPVTDNGDGTYTATLTSTTIAGVDRVGATVTGGDGPVAAAPTDIRQLAGPPTRLALALSSTGIPANGTASTVATITAIDANGNPAPGATLTLTSSDLGVGIGPITDNGTGTYRATITASRTPGTVTLTAEVPGATATATLLEVAVPAVPVAVTATQRLANTGTDLALPLIVGPVLLLLGTATVTLGVLRRRRAR